MASKRNLRKKQCGRKERFETLEAATKAMRRAETIFSQRNTMSPYRCPFCKGFHYGHRPVRQQSAHTLQQAIQ